MSFGRVDAPADAARRRSIRAVHDIRACAPGRVGTVEDRPPFSLGTRGFEYIPRNR